MKWTEQTIVVPNCNWTGYEADILAVAENLRPDVE